MTLYTNNLYQTKTPYFHGVQIGLAGCEQSPSSLWRTNCTPIASMQFPAQFRTLIAQIIARAQFSGIVARMFAHAQRLSDAPRMLHLKGITPTILAWEAHDEAQEGTKSALSRHQVKTLHICLYPNSLKELVAYFKRTDRTKFRNQVIDPLLDTKYLEMTRPEAPTSRLQKYRTTESGKQALASEI